MEGKQFNVIMDRLVSLDTKKLKWETLPSDFMEGLMLCAPNVKNDLTLGSMAGLAVISQQDEILFIATDNQRISVYTSKGKLSEGFVLPAEVIGDVIKYGKEIESIAITDNWIHFGDQKGLILSTRKLMGEYPVVKVMDVLKNNMPDGSERPYQLPEGLEQALNRAEILSQLDMAIPTISLERKGEFLIVRGERDAGQIEDKVVWEKEGMPENLIIIISPEFLRRVLKITREFKINPNKNAAMFEGKNFQHLMVITVESK
jgi:DNA polymerase III sliding clamp (beta) subunit (PCNA family)